MMFPYHTTDKRQMVFRKEDVTCLICGRDKEDGDLVITSLGSVCMDHVRCNQLQAKREGR